MKVWVVYETNHFSDAETESSETNPIGIFTSEQKAKDALDNVEIVNFGHWKMTLDNVEIGRIEKFELVGEVKNGKIWSLSKRKNWGALKILKLFGNEELAKSSLKPKFENWIAQREGLYFQEHKKDQQFLECWSLDKVRS